EVERHRRVARALLPAERAGRHADLEAGNRQCAHRERPHFTITTVVPCPGLESIENSSVSRRAPGRPSPMPLPVLYPSSIARSTSRMPGPSSRATTRMPARSSFCTTERTISPSPAYVVMLRAISEIAVASSVMSVEVKFSSDARARASRRAATTSESDAIATRSSSLTRLALLRPFLQERHALLEVERRVDVLHANPQLHHRERHLGLDPHQHCLGAAQARHVGDVAQRARDERVHHVERGDVDDDPPRAEAPDLLD